MSDIDTVVVNSLKALDPEWPIREADMAGHALICRSLLSLASLIAGTPRQHRVDPRCVVRMRRKPRITGSSRCHRRRRQSPPRYRASGARWRIAHRRYTGSRIHPSASQRGYLITTRAVTNSSACSMVTGRQITASPSRTPSTSHHTDWDSRNEGFGPWSAINSCTTPSAPNHVLESRGPLRRHGV